MLLYLILNRQEGFYYFYMFNIKLSIEENEKNMGYSNNILRYLKYVFCFNLLFKCKGKDFIQLVRKFLILFVDDVSFSIQIFINILIIICCVLL